MTEKVAGHAHTKDRWTAAAFCIAPLLLGFMAAHLGLSLPQPHTHWRYPAYWPPLWVFGSVWAVIYPSWGFATYLLWRRRQDSDVRGALVFFAVAVISSFFFMPVAGLSGNNPMIMVLGDVNGVINAIAVAWLYSMYERKAFYFTIPLLIWMPLTLMLKLAYWRANA